jgi:hypothetical protein
VGDALNWEWIVHCSQNLRGRIYIVTRDGDYGCELNGNYYLNDQLKAEFRDRVGNKSIVYTKRLSDALKALEVHVSKEEKEAEDSALSTPVYTPDITAAWKSIQMPSIGTDIQAAFKASQLSTIGEEWRKAIEQSTAQLREMAKALREAQHIREHEEA